MKAILYFCAFAVTTKFDKKHAKLIADETGEKVVFRNGAIAMQSNERPEPCLGYAGLVPDKDDYKFKPVYNVNEDGKVVRVDSAGDVVSNKKESEDKEELNKIGLPIGSPETRDELKEALKDAEVEFHGNAKVELLVELYRSEILVEGEE